MGLEEYAKEHLQTALKRINESERIDELLNLSIYEKAIIFAYTDTRNNLHKDVNKKLWESNGSEIDIFGNYLEESLDKLENYKGQVFRGVQDSVCDIERYKSALENKSILVEFGFLSASRSQIIAIGFGQILFKIYSKSAKEIEKISHFKSEEEVIFKRNTSFKVFRVSIDDFFTIIILKEV